MFMAALFRIAKSRNHPEVLQPMNWIKQTWDGHPVEYYSVIKMNKIVSLLERWMDLERDIQRRKSEREKQRLNINVYVWD